MTKEEVLAKIIEAVNPVDPVTLETEIMTSEDFNSLGLFNIIAEFRPLGIKLGMRDLLSVNTVGDLVELILSRMA